MALFPLVLLYQEFATVSTTANEPDLVTLIAGPAYQLMDYPEDSAATAGGAWGDITKPQSSVDPDLSLPYSSNLDDIVFASPPGMVSGAVLDESSVRVFLKNVYARIPEVDDVGGVFGTGADANLFTGAGAADFMASGVRPGDRLVTTTVPDAAEPDDTTAHIITQVGGYAGSTLAANQVRVSGSYYVDGVDINGVGYSGAQLINKSYRVERLLDSVELLKGTPEDPVNFAVDAGQITLFYRLELSATDIPEYPGVLTIPVHAGDIYFEYKALRQDLADVGSISEETEIESLVGKVDDRNPLAVGLLVTLQNTVTSVQYFGITGDNLNNTTDRLTSYLAMATAIEARKDTYAIVPLTDELAIINALHDVAVGASTPEVSKFQAVYGNMKRPLIAEKSAPSIGFPEELGTSSVDIFIAREGIQMDLTNVPATNSDLAIYGTLTGNNDDYYAILNVLPNGRGFRVDSSLVAENDTDPGNAWWVIHPTARGTNYGSLSDLVVVSGDSTIGVANADASGGDVGLMLDMTFITPGPALSGNSYTDNDYFYVLAVGAADSHSAGYTEYTLAMNGVWPDSSSGATAVKTAALAADPYGHDFTTRKAYSILDDAGATFVADGAIVGDLLEVTIVPDAFVTTERPQLVYTFPITVVTSNNRLSISDAYDIPTDTGLLDVTANASYRVIRTLSKDQQVDEMIAIAESLASKVDSKRVLLTWPDEVRVSGVVNTKTNVQSFLPGYYMSCVVGGMSAGLPPQQGFTNIGIVGIDEIRGSTRYFTQAQIVRLSNAGVYVFAQETRNTLPYCVHQLTVDVSTTANGELSMVRDFDYVSRFYKDIVDGFIGKYNVIEPVLGILRANLNAGTRQLQSLTKPNIGAPITNATVTSIKILEGQRDHVEIYMALDMPAPLNRISLRLVA
jgi:hypothetical protein